MYTYVYLYIYSILYAKFGLKSKEDTVFHVLDSTPLLPLLTKVMSLVLAKLNDFMLCSTIVSEFSLRSWREWVRARNLLRRSRYSLAGFAREGIFASGKAASKIPACLISYPF